MIVPMSLEYVDQVARLHRQCLHSLLTDLGPRLCRDFYRQALRSPNCLAFIDVEKGRVRGFAVGALDNSRLFQAWPLRLALLGALCRHPARLPHLLFHVSNDLPPAPEVIYEAVAPEHRRQGIATSLSHALHEAFRQRGVTRYEIRVDRDNLPNLARHLKYGARVFREFREHGVQRCLLERTIEPQPLSRPPSVKA